MFAKLPDLLGKNFVIGYLLPAFAFIILNYLIDGEYNFLPNNISLSYLQQVSLTEQITILALLSFIAGILLLIFNRDIIVLIEGYGKYNPFRILQKRQKSRFKKLQKNISATEQEYCQYSDRNQIVPLKIQQKYQDLLEAKTRNFPDREQLVLPTSFGNILRAFETYSRVMYGADSIPVWTRLLAVIPKDYQQFIDTAKTLVDFWVNTWLINVATFVIYLGNLICYRQLKLVFLPFICLIAAYIAYQKAKRAAVSWGNFVKAAFDLFLGDLQKKLAITHDDPDSEDNTVLWQKFSQAILYNNPESIALSIIN